MTRWWRFPPLTEEIQFDEKWAFVYQKERRCDPERLADQYRGESWDHVAFDPEHRLVLEVVPGKRHQQQTRTLIRAAQRRTGGRVMRLLTSDEYRAYRRRSSRRMAYKRKSPAPVNRDDRAPPRRFRRPICSTQRCIRRAAMDGWSTSNPGCSLAPKKGWKKPWRSRPSVIRSIPLLALLHESITIRVFPQLSLFNS